MSCVVLKDYYNLTCNFARACFVWWLRGSVRLILTSVLRELTNVSFFTCTASSIYVRKLLLTRVWHQANQCPLGSVKNCLYGRFEYGPHPAAGRMNIYAAIDSSNFSAPVTFILSASVGTLLPASPLTRPAWMLTLYTFAVKEMLVSRVRYFQMTGTPSRG